MAVLQLAIFAHQPIDLEYRRFENGGSDIEEIWKKFSDKKQKIFCLNFCGIFQIF